MSVTASGGTIDHRPAANGSSERRRGVLYPNHYAWYVLAATLDVIVTHQILHHFNGSEVNKLASALIERYGLPGMVGLKYASIVVVILICEYIGRRRVNMGRRLAIAAICISALPVGIGLLQLAAWTKMPTATLLVDPVTGEITDLGR